MRSESAQETFEYSFPAIERARNVLERRFSEAKLVAKTGVAHQVDRQVQETTNLHNELEDTQNSTGVQEVCSNSEMKKAYELQHQQQIETLHIAVNQIKTNASEVNISSERGNCEDYSLEEDTGTPTTEFEEEYASHSQVTYDVIGKCASHGDRDAIAGISKIVRAEVECALAKPAMHEKFFVNVAKALQ